MHQQVVDIITGFMFLSPCSVVLGYQPFEGLFCLHL